MHLSFVTIFPEIYTSFFDTSLFKKAVEKGLISYACINPRDFCHDKHKQIDDVIYGGGAGMLMKAQPIIDAVESVLRDRSLYGSSLIDVNSTAVSNQSNISSQVSKSSNRKIIFLSPSETIFNQTHAYNLCKLDHIIFVSGRYEGIDHRFEQYMQKKYPDNFEKVSLGQFITLGGEVPSMLITEAIVRLIPGVIKEEDSHLIESYDPEQGMNNLEYPQYTRPEEVEGMKVPDILLSGHHKQIQKRRDESALYL